jgi:hypothetical protein
VRKRLAGPVQREQHAQQRRHAADGGDPGAPRRDQDGPGADGGRVGHVQRAAGQQRGEEGCDAGAAAQRVEQQHAVGRREVELVGPVYGAGQHLALRADDALRPTGAAGGVDDEARRVLRRRRRHARGSGRRCHGLGRHVQRDQRQRAWQSGRGAAERQDQSAGAGVGQDVGQPRGGVVRVEADARPAGGKARQDAAGRIDRVRQQRGDGGAQRGRRVHPLGQGGRAVEQLAVADRTGTGLYRRCFRVAPRHLGEGCEQRAVVEALLRVGAGRVREALPGVGPG